MPDELFAILGAEAALLVFLAAMAVHAKRMDVLSGRHFERLAVSATGNGPPPLSVRAHARNLLRLARKWARTRARTLIRTWGSVAKIAPPSLSQWRDPIRSSQSSLSNEGDRAAA
jgi:hypothetical protein